MSSWLSMLGMARKAGKVVIGEEAAQEAVLAHKARLILIAADAGSTTAGRAARLGNDKLPVLTIPEGRTELGAVLGFASVAVAAVCELGFASAVAEKLAAEVPEAAEAANLLKEKRKKAVRRKADTVKNGKKSSRR